MTLIVKILNDKGHEIANSSRQFGPWGGNLGAQYAQELADRLCVAPEIPSAQDYQQEPNRQ